MKRAQMTVAGLGLIAAVHGVASGEMIFGLTNLQQLVTFDSQSRTVMSTTSLSGFSIGGEFMIGIDVRPATGELFGLSNQNNLYRINAASGVASQVGGTLTPGPGGAYRMLDFNPTVDRIRIMGSDGTNLRVNPDTGAVLVDGSLAFATGDANEGDAPQIVNAAYTNSVAGATTTTLYTIDAFNDILATQVPPNNGTQNTIGPIGSDIASSSGFTGFDISGSSGAAYLVGNSLLGGGLAVNTLYSVNLTTGQALALGGVSGINGSFRDIAVVPAPGSALVLGVATIAFGRRRRSA